MKPLTFSRWKDNLIYLLDIGTQTSNYRHETISLNTTKGHSLELT